jgi:hypothetical protein
LEALALCHLGRTDEARSVLRDLAIVTLRDNFPLVGNDCVLALALITEKEGDLAAAARLMELVIADPRLRAQPTYFFAGRKIADMETRLRQSGVDPGPTVADFATRVNDIIEGGRVDFAAAERSHAALVEFAETGTVSV